MSKYIDTSIIPENSYKVSQKHSHTRHCEKGVLPDEAIVPEMILEIKNGSDPLNAPYGLALDSSGKIYVNDAGTSRVLVFDNGGNFLRSFGSKSITKSLFQQPVAIALDGNGHFYVVNQKANNVQVFNLP